MVQYIASASVQLQSFKEFLTHKKQHQEQKLILQLKIIVHIKTSHKK